MNIKKEQEEMIVNFGAFNYNAEKIASILEVNIDIVNNELKTKNSKLKTLYQKGKDMADYVIDLKLFDLAKMGDIKAIEKLDSRKWERENI